MTTHTLPKATEASTQPTPRKDYYQEITDSIIRLLENGTVPWQQPWTSAGKYALGLPFNFQTGNKYQGINIVMLWAKACEYQYASDQWATFDQWNSLKERVRKGEKGTKILKFGTYQKEVDDEIEERSFVQWAVVFNRCQLESFKPEDAYYMPPNCEMEVMEEVSEFVTNTQTTITHYNAIACYSAADDAIRMPYKELLTGDEYRTVTDAYYDVLFHELIHWTRHPSRLNRKSGNQFGDKDYAYEELIAELGAAFLRSHFKVSDASLTMNAAYIANWIKRLKDDKYAIVKAASAAGKAVDYLLSLNRPA